ncbi:hypothetical protein [Janthinobacterium rivuli]|uniref:hypothetical protein n=1 Tax=Janthinobacterium rivuli TaxID=2751478 RepID=UPI00383A857F
MMVKHFKDLSDEQVAKFNARCAQLGVDPSKIQTSVTTAGAEDGLHCGHPAANSTFPPANILKVANVAQLKALCACKDEDYVRGLESDAQVRYPQPLSELALPPLSSHGRDVALIENFMTETQKAAVVQALHAFLVGNSNKVKDYEAIINAIHFPMSLAVYAAQDITITAANPLVLDSDQIGLYNFGVVTVEPGGSIQVVTAAQMDSQVFNGQTALGGAGGTVPTINFRGANGSDGTDGTAGTNGSNGGNAVQGSPSGNNCDCNNPSPVAATASGNGTAGSAGTRGADGSISGTSVFSLGAISGPIQVTYIGGVGGKGGAGKAGGNGGNGGNAAGAAAAPCNNSYAGTPSGNGANGGNGGNGGNGANGPNVTIYYSSITSDTTFSIDTSSIAAGSGGAAGAGGAAGSGGTGGGTAGNPGTAGVPGITGSPGTLSARLQPA